MSIIFLFAEASAGFTCQKLVPGLTDAIRHAKAFSSSCASGLRKVLPEAAHSINPEQPEAFNRNVMEFIRKHWRKRREDCPSLSRSRQHGKIEELLWVEVGGQGSFLPQYL